MTRRRWLASLLVAATLLVGCGGGEVTPIEDVAGGNLEDGAVVTVTGTVTDIRPLPVIRQQSYVLASPGGDQVTVLTESAAPTRGSTVTAKGEVRTAFRVEGLDLGTVLMEEERLASPLEDVLPAWAWFAIGIGLALLTTIVVIVMSRRRSKKTAGDACPHCEKERKADWVSCAWCGKDLKTSPPSSQTIISHTPVVFDEPVSQELPGASSDDESPS